MREISKIKLGKMEFKAFEALSWSKALQEDFDVLVCGTVTAMR